ncbi:MAG: serine/threonine protein kinase [Planctomycetes bacterium]|nr:serine/threonine protein kinase [Planctomycetota bacterium]
MTIRRLGPYEAVEELGRGANGAVYRALDLRDPARQVALKVLFASSTEGIEFGRFRREVLALAELNHPNVVRLIDSGVEEGVTWLAMTLIHGESLRELLRRQGALPNELAARLALGISAGLEHAHGLGILHRDLKPRNVLVDPAGEAVLTDFGLARLSAQNDRLTQTGEVLGTGAYLAPEQADGQRVDERADVYALGATLYQMLSGQPPFAAPTWLNLVVKVLSEVPPAPSTINPQVASGLEAICLRCLATPGSGTVAAGLKGRSRAPHRAPTMPSLTTRLGGRSCSLAAGTPGGDTSATPGPGTGLSGRGGARRGPVRGATRPRGRPSTRSPRPLRRHAARRPAR